MTLAQGWQWENSRPAEVRKQGRSLQHRCFVIQYNARLDSRTFDSGASLQESMGITVKAKKIDALDSRVVRQYATHIEHLRPILQGGPWLVAPDGVDSA